MEWYFVGIGVLVLLVVLIGAGLPIPFALVVASLPFLWTIQDWTASMMSVELMLSRAWGDYILLAVPLFIFLSELVGRSDIGPRLYQAMHRGVRLRGSAAYGSLGACAAFGAVCGSSMIGALTVGKVALPEMLKLGYGKRLSSGVIAAGGTLSVLIPPSLILLFYGVVCNVSIGDLFIAGIVPGLILTGLLAAVVLGWTLLKPADVPAADRGSRWLLIESVVAFAPILVIGFIISASIYFGIATPTEAAAVGCAATIVLAFALGGLDWRGFAGSLAATVKTMGYLGVLLSGALLLGFVLNYHRVPQQFTELFVSFQLAPIAVLAMVIAFYLVLGMFLEPASMTFITLPTMFPIVKAAGYDPIWFGIVYTVTMEIAALTPPVGLNLYVLEGISQGKVHIGDVIMGCLPFVGAMVVLIALLLAFPGIALWLVKP
jgi:tripartite ATP-independent transporter DctM subunit